MINELRSRYCLKLPVADDLTQHRDRLVRESEPHGQSQGYPIHVGWILSSMGGNLQKADVLRKETCRGIESAL